MPRTIDYTFGDIDWADAGELGSDGYVDPVPGYDDSTEFDDQFEMRSRELQSKPSNLIPVTIAQNRSGAWSGNNQLGIELPFQANAVNEQTILKMDEWGFPQVWSVQLGLSYTDQVASLFQVTAKVRAGSGGITDEFEVDWNNGACFRTVMNAINIVAAYTQTTNLPTDLRLRVIIGHRSLSGAKPRRSFNNLQVNAGNQLFVTIPRYATSYHVIGIAQNPYAAGILYDVLQNTVGPGTLMTLDGTSVLSVWNNDVVLPAASNTLRITNTTGVNLTFGLVFELGL